MIIIVEIVKFVQRKLGMDKMPFKTEKSSSGGFLIVKYNKNCRECDNFEYLLI